jgi:hypothetical protein
MVFVFFILCYTLVSRLLEQEGANEVSVVARNNIHNVVSEAYDTLQPKPLRLATDINLSWAKKFHTLERIRQGSNRN